jgi:hypothetical protein
MTCRRGVWSNGLFGTLVFLWAAALPVGAIANPRPHVYVVVVDGLDAVWLPRLTRLAAARQAGVCPLTTAAAQAVMPARTNSSHISLLTGLYPAAHGITGNRYWNRDPDTDVMPLEETGAVEAETLFSVIETETPALRTVGVFGKAKLGSLFGAVAGRQRASDVQWAPGAKAIGFGSLAAKGSRVGDAAVMDAALAALDAEPDLAVVSLSGVDGAAHAEGIRSAALARALDTADTQLARLIDAIRERGWWERSIVVVTSDHGFTDVRPAPGRDHLYPSFADDLRAAGIDGLRVASDGGVAHVYVERMPRLDAVAADAATRLLAARALALRTPGVVEALFRLRVDGAGEDTLVDVARPRWQIGHPRSGDLIVVAAPGIMFGDPPEQREHSLMANHGGPAQLPIPIVLCGGAPEIRREGATLTGEPTLADVGATLFAWLGQRPPRRFDGVAIPPAARGVPIAAVVTPANR